jgi:excisionase family DNA binding protein
VCDSLSLAVSVSRSSSRSRLSVGTRETSETTQPEDRTNYERKVLLLTMIEAARVLSIGRTTMYELVDTGEIDVVHIGRSVRVPVDALHAFVERRRAD